MADKCRCGDMARLKSHCTGSADAQGGHPAVVTPSRVPLHPLSGGTKSEDQAQRSLFPRLKF